MKHPTTRGRGQPRKPPVLHPQTKLTLTGEDLDHPGYWLCRCECGQAKSIRRGNLPVTISCGCHRRANLKKRWVSKGK
jgi:hypothetical protein